MADGGITNYYYGRLLKMVACKEIIITCMYYVRCTYLESCVFLHTEVKVECRVFSNIWLALDNTFSLASYG